MKKIIIFTNSTNDYNYYTQLDANRTFEKYMEELRANSNDKVYMVTIEEVSQLNND